MTGSGAKRGVRIYRKDVAPLLEDTDFMSTPDMSEETASGISTLGANGLLTGSRLKVLVRQPDDEGGFSLVHVWFKPNYPLVRHSHDVDCMYYVLSGSLKMGNQTLSVGDSFFVPAGAPYAYQAGPDGVEVLEIRHGVVAFGMKIFDASPQQWSSMLKTVQAQSPEWEGMQTSLSEQ